MQSEAESARRQTRRVLSPLSQSRSAVSLENIINIENTGGSCGAAVWDYQEELTDPSHLFQTDVDYGLSGHLECKSENMVWAQNCCVFCNVSSRFFFFFYNKLVHCL